MLAIFSIVFVTGVWMCVSVLRGGHKGVVKKANYGSLSDPKGGYYDKQHYGHYNRRGRLTNHTENDR